ncbi:MAG: formylglycine-generating enzyme family protein [Leptospirales bacterium]|nr:formylglycine-generating enzyme family protein [Leptospirales bacterium]
MKNKLFGISTVIAAIALAGIGYGTADNAGTVEMVKINGGMFIMGSPEDEPGRWPVKDSETQHPVTVSGFYIGKYEITQKQFEDVMGYNASYFLFKLLKNIWGDNASYFIGNNLPVEGVTWFDAVAFCNKLSDKEGLEKVYTITDVKRDGNSIEKATVTADWTKNGYRLPTNAEWEYACRAGTTTPFNTGDNITTDQANYNGTELYYNNPKGIYRKKPTPVGSFAPNAWGLYDMHGNVGEWCWDGYEYYSTEAQTNPKGPDNGTDASMPYNNVNERVLRGGSWGGFVQFLRSASRSSAYPQFNRGGGIRVARNQ